jgi:hypothetical protein
MAALLEEAARRYVTDTDRGLPSRRVPRFLKEGDGRLGDATVDVELDAGLWSALDREAESQEVSIELIVAHAAILYAAELDA